MNKDTATRGFYYDVFIVATSSRNHTLTHSLNTAWIILLSETLNDQNLQNGLIVQSDLK